MICPRLARISTKKRIRETTGNEAHTHGQAGGDVGELAQLACYRVHLDAQLSGGYEHKHARYLRFPRLIQETLQYRQHERCSLTCEREREIKARAVLKYNDRHEPNVRHYKPPEMLHGIDATSLSLQ